jgi:hypothetical protein
MMSKHPLIKRGSLYPGDCLATQLFSWLSIIFVSLKNLRLDQPDPTMNRMKASPADAINRCRCKYESSAS